jgi:hypothetical protein
MGALQGNGLSPKFEDYAASSWMFPVAAFIQIAYMQTLFNSQQVLGLLIQPLAGWSLCTPVARTVYPVAIIPRLFIPTAWIKGEFSTTEIFTAWLTCHSIRYINDIGKIVTVSDLEVL